jgi:Predicted ATPase (AAA+ superfamily)
MIPRTLTAVLHQRASSNPVVTLLGPRQSGKTTLCKATFSDKAYVSLEPLDTRDYAKADPRGFLDQFGDHGVVLDEIQNAPELLHYIQDRVDNNGNMGQYILTGSQNLVISAKVSQSLAGRTAILTLLPLSYTEISQAATPPANVWEAVWKGGYPRLYNQAVAPEEWLADYILTYLQRDVRQLVNVGNLDQFSRFLQLSAAHTAQEVNYTTLGNDVGLSHNTIRTWSSVLQESFLTATLTPWLGNIRKRLVKTPKQHFLDTGVVCSLLGISNPEQLRLHPLRGAIFESWVVAELHKHYLNQGKKPGLYHYRENSGLEFDVLMETPAGLTPIEIKSAQTINSEFFKNFTQAASREELATQLNVSQGKIVYAGDTPQIRHGVRVIPWGQLSGI